jgi:uncharacterized protein YndB with AHSA1/START domain
MAPIVTSVEISKSPEEVFAYVTQPSNLPKWQASAVGVKHDGTQVHKGSRVVVTRQAGPRKMDMTVEIAELDPPRRWAIRGVDGPVRGNAIGTIEPLDNGQRSRVTINLDFDGRGIGKVLVPLVVKRQAAREMPENMQRLKQQLEGNT